MAISPFTFINTAFWPIAKLNMASEYNWRRDLLWLYNCAFPVVTMEELNSLGFASPMGCFESTSYTMRYRLFAVKEEKLGLRYQSSASIRHPCFLLFPLLEKGLSKKGKDRSDVSDFILKWAAFYAERFVHHYKGTVHFYRECERVVICIWDWGEMTDKVVLLFPKCT